MKIILDINTFADAHKALSAYMEVSRDMPNQTSGEQVPVLIQGQKFIVVRNQGSYTVKAV